MSLKINVFPDILLTPLSFPDIFEKKYARMEDIVQTEVPSKCQECQECQGCQQILKEMSVKDRAAIENQWFP